MIIFDKNFVEERKRREKEKLDKFRDETKEDYKIYITKKDDIKHQHRRNQTEDKDKLSLILKPDERFFQYQQKYFKHTINSQKDIIENNKSDDRSASNTINFEYSPVKSIVNYKQISGSTVTENSRYNQNSPQFNKIQQTDQNRIGNENAYAARDGNKLFQSLQHERNSLSLGKQQSSEFLLHKQKRLEDENKMLNNNPYSMKSINIGTTRIKDNPLVFDSATLSYNQSEKRLYNSSLRNAGTRILQN